MKKTKVIILMLITVINITTLQAYAAATSENNYEIRAQQTISVTDIDLGDYQKQMQVGENQLLNITLIPTNATNVQIMYTSSNRAVAEINGLGRITAIAVGQTTITVKAENIERKFILTIKEKDEEPNIPVADIQTTEYQEEMDVGKTQNITVTIVPSNATNQTIEYKSSNPKIAEINSSGTITAKAKGTATITIKSGKITKRLPLTVKISTTSIQVDETYLVLKPGQTKQLKVKITPKEADQNLTYTVTDKKIITVNNSGQIKAHTIGRSSVIIKNKDMQKIVTVIVNKEGNSTTAASGETTEGEQVLSAYTDEIIEQMANIQEDEITIEGNGEQILTKEILKYMYENKKNLTINCEGYVITIKGQDIQNYENELTTKIEFEQTKEGTIFTLNENNPLPGKITIHANKETIKNGQYLYLYNTSKEKYEMLKTKIQEGTLNWI